MISAQSKRIYDAILYVVRTLNAQSAADQDKIRDQAKALQTYAELVSALQNQLADANGKNDQYKADLAASNDQNAAYKADEDQDQAIIDQLVADVEALLPNGPEAPVETNPTTATDAVIEAAAESPAENTPEVEAALESEVGQPVPTSDAALESAVEMLVKPDSSSPDLDASNEVAAPSDG